MIALCLIVHTNSNTKAISIYTGNSVAHRTSLPISHPARRSVFPFRRNYVEQLSTRKREAQSCSTLRLLPCFHIAFLHLPFVLARVW